MKHGKLNLNKKLHLLFSYKNLKNIQQDTSEANWRTLGMPNNQKTAVTLS